MNTDKKISGHIKSIADMYNSLYENKMRDKFQRNPKTNKLDDRKRVRKVS
jgi:hypothetical protein